MINLGTVYLAPDDIDALITPLLRDGFKQYGFRGKTIEEDETVSGDPIIRVRADVERSVPASEVVSVLNRIHMALRSRSDDRIVFLSAFRPSPSGNPGTDEDEDAI